MKIIILAILTALSIAPVFASECDALVAQIINKTGVTFVKFASDNEAILRDGSVKIDVNCNIRTADIENPSIFPPARFFELAGEIGGFLTGAAPQTIKSTAKKCQMQALEKSGIAEFELPKVSISCYFKRNLSAYVLVIPNK